MPGSHLESECYGPYARGLGIYVVRIDIHLSKPELYSPIIKYM